MAMNFCYYDAKVLTHPAMNSPGNDGVSSHPYKLGLSFPINSVAELRKDLG